MDRPLTAFVQQEFPFAADLTDKRRRPAYERRNDPLFLRNQFDGVGAFGIPLVRRQDTDLRDVRLIACTNTVRNERTYRHCGVQFFVDDYRFPTLYASPERTYPIYSQYAFCCTPDFSVYGEMQTWRQIVSVARNRWCGAGWQSRGMKVVTTISWDRYPSFGFCFDGVEDGSVVAVATYACRSSRMGFMRGYDAMLERIRPSAVICYGEAFREMRGNVIAVPTCHPRRFHRDPAA